MSALPCTVHIDLNTQIFGSLIQETRELPDGYAYCFLSFQLDVAPFAGPVWLQLTAEGDVKPFLREEIGHYLPAH